MKGPRSSSNGLAAVGIELSRAGTSALDEG